MEKCLCSKVREKEDDAKSHIQSIFCVKTTKVINSMYGKNIGRKYIILQLFWKLVLKLFFLLFYYLLI